MGETTDRAARGPRRDSPAQLSPPEWRVVLTRTAHEFRIHQCWDLAAALTYHAVLSVCPALLAAAAFLGLFGSAEPIARGALGVVGDLGGDETVAALTEPISQLLSASQAGLAFLTGFAVTLWTISGYLGTFGRGMNRILGVPEGRPFWKSRPVMLAAAAVITVLAAVIVGALIVSGAVAASVVRSIGWDDDVALVWDLGKLPVLAGLAALIVAILYWATPNVRRPNLRWLSVGAAVALVAWMVTTAAFAVYVWNYASYDRTYGVLGGVVAFLLWLWLSNLAVLAGAVLDTEVERARQLRAGIAAQERLRLPLRDDRLVHVNERQRRRDVLASARMLPDAEPDGAG
ncbi:YihY/virulence factor BrkB family protein [Agromyces sp. NPDC056523]|uniref:YihY/virulence factor BrkB family protein n=1 Tax=Agromyces sp. NPDC056523 TaxID=3345850 RepID=UPI00366D2E39